MIRWHSVSVTYSGRVVLDAFDLEVDRGQWVGLIGPNGAGKSTVLKTAVSAISFSGSVTLSGSMIKPGIDVAWMPQRPMLPEAMGVADYVMLGRTPHLGYLAAESKTDVETVGWALERLDLLPLAPRALGTLSGGEAQRVVLARALAQEAPVLLLDEPTASLDIGHAVEVLEVVDSLRESEDLTVVCAAHDLTLAGRFADRLVLLGDGLVVADGSPEAVLTESSLRGHYGHSLRVIPDKDGPIVVPERPLND